ncbi:TetR/AcrR family transcriptional regulator [Actinoplanes sp. NPDC051494]|uniref:TetR/AcrR family transcriptional regulator n=1 Tax=Actinoplanes sp. NPDC051494 TaxID=3363907 RepID=UPI0037B7E7C7
MAPEDRRAALVSATLPLLREFGLEVSTRQIAAAAGVAEGTIFGVYSDKNSLLVDVLMDALDPDPTLRAIQAIDSDLPLRARLAAAAELVHERFTTHAPLMTAARKLVFMSGAHPEAAARMGAARGQLQAALAELVLPDAALLRRAPDAVAGLFLLFCGGNAFGPFGDPDRFDGEELVSLLLDGLLVSSSTDHGGA